MEMIDSVRRVGALSISLCICMSSMSVYAEEATTTRDYLNSINAGVTNIVGSGGRESEQSKEAMDELAALAEENAPAEESPKKNSKTNLISSTKPKLHALRSCKKAVQSVQKKRKGAKK